MQGCDALHKGNDRTIYFNSNDSPFPTAPNKSRNGAILKEGIVFLTLNKLFHQGHCKDDIVHHDRFFLSF